MLTYEEKYDVIVVGASPAGLIASWKAAERGIRVLLLEQKHRFESASSPADTSFDGFFRMVGLKPRAEYIVHRVKGMNVVSPLGTTATIEAPGFSIDRRLFDAYYARLAMDAGVEVKFNSEVLSVTSKSVTAREEDSEKAYNGEIIVIASGNPEITSRIGLKTMKHPEDLAYAIQAEMDGVEIDEDYFHYFIGKEVAPGWKATISPKGDSEASVGVFVRGANPRTYFDKFLQRKMLNRAKVCRIVKGADQIITMPNDLVKNNLMTVGGAAGQAGIAYGMAAGALCGEIAAEAIDKGTCSREFLSRYEKRWKKLYLNHYKAGRFGLTTMERMSDSDLDVLVGALKGVDLFRELSRHSNILMNSLSLGILLLQGNPRVIRLMRYLSFF